MLQIDGNSSAVTMSRQNSSEQESSSSTNTNLSIPSPNGNPPRNRTPLPNARQTSNNTENSDSPKEAAPVGIILEETTQSELTGQATSIIPLQMQDRPKRKRKPSEGLKRSKETLNFSMAGKKSKGRSSASKKAPEGKVKAAGRKSKFVSGAANRAKLEGDVPSNENEEVQKAVTQAKSSGNMPLDVTTEVLQAADTLMFVSEGGHPADRKLVEQKALEQRFREHETALTLLNMPFYTMIREKMAKQEASTGMSLPNTQSPNWRKERKTEGAANKEGGTPRQQTMRSNRAKFAFKDDCSDDTVSNPSDDEGNNIRIESTSSDNKDSDTPFAPPQPKLHKPSSSKAKVGAGRGQRVPR